MLFKKQYRTKIKPSTYTLMLIPGKYGSPKTLHIPRWTINFIIYFNLIALILIAIFIFNYKGLKNSYNKYLDDNEQLELMNKAQENEIMDLRKSADEIKSKLEELKNLEKQLRDKLNLNSLNTNDSINSNDSKTAYLNASIDISEDIDTQINAINEALYSADIKIKALNSKPSILPSNGTITCFFGKRRNPFGGRSYEFHEGLDISDAYGSEIKASGDGIVEYSGWKIGYGKTIIINHGYNYETLYGHNSLLLVSQGQRVKRGQVISLMGSTGRSTGTHVHFEIRINGVQVNPLIIINGGV